MVQGVKVQKDQGTPQGGPLSPLLANVMLDEVDRELERRGHEFVRYADDCNVYVKTRRAGQRVLQTLRRCYAKLRLVVNEAKTAVAPVWGRKFLGYSLVVGQGGARLVVAKQALDKLRDRLRRSTRRSSGRSLAQIAEELRAYVPGWKAYFRLAPMPSVRRELDSWLRHRLRAPLRCGMKSKCLAQHLHGVQLLDVRGSGSEAASAASSPHSIQSSPNSSIGCGVRMLPLPHISEWAGQ